MIKGHVAEAKSKGNRMQQSTYMIQGEGPSQGLRLVMSGGNHG